LGATITDTSVTDPAFVVERFGLEGGRLEVAGHWHGVRGRRFVRPVLWLHQGEARRRLVAVLDHKPWAADDGDPWLAAFAWEGGALDADRAELEVGRELVVDLPLPGRKAPPSTPARPRRPSELERAREELSAATRERRALEAALETATSDAGRLEQLRDERDRAVAERDRAVEAAERARADGERLVNDEYRQREQAQESADRAAERARGTEAAHELARRQLSAARESYAALEAERDEVRRQRDEARERLAVAMAEGDELRERLEAAAAERERLLGATVEHDVLAEVEAPAAEEARRESEELANVRAERQRLEAELAGAWADREQLVAELAAARAGRERVEAELVAARSDRKRLERELAGRVETAPARPTVRVSPFTQSRTAPPSSGGGLWFVRLIALAMVIALLGAAVVLLTGVL
jgi:DNA repair exonuclease SbcCD ATPase subunit